MNLTFLNGLFLAGLAAAAIPIIIHLLQRRRLKRIEFSDLRFLAPLNQQRMRSMNLRRWLLLLLRVAIVALTAFAMARPSIRGGLSDLVPTQARSSVLVMLDTSYSMRAEGNRGTALDVGRQAAYRIIESMQQGDEINLMTFDSSVRRWFQTPVHDFDVVRDRVANIEASYAGTNWLEAFETSLAELRRTIEPNRELYVISDFSGIDPESLSVDLSAAQNDVRISLVPVRVEPFVNVSIEGVQVPPGAILRDDPFSLAVTVQNHAADVPADCVLRVDMDGEPKGETNLRLGKAALQTKDFTLVATEAREIEGLVSKRVDRMPVDDLHHFVLPVLAELEVLHIRHADNRGGGFFVSRALEPSRQDKSPIRLREVVSSRFSSADLDGIRVVIVSSDARLTDSQSQILAAYVEQGGGLCLFTGLRDTADSANRLLSRLGDTRVRGVVLRQEGYINLADLRPSGILAGFQSDELRTLERTQFTRYAELVAGSVARTVLRFAGEAPALVEGSRGTGKYMVLGFDAASDGSDLALSTMFLPLVHRTVVYLAGATGRQRLHYEVGDRIEVQVPLTRAGQRAENGRAPWPRRAQADDFRGQDEAWRHQDGDAYLDDRLAQAGRSDGGAVPAPDPTADPERGFTVTTPDGTTQAVEARFVGKIAFASFEDTHLPGHYVFEGMGQRLVRAVNVHTGESNLAAFEPVGLTKALGLRADELRNATAIGQHIHEARHGKEIYKLVIALVIVLLVVELLVSRVAASKPAA